MKRTFTLLFSLILLASTGYALQNRLTISSRSNNNFRIIIDGRTYQLDKNAGELLLKDLRPGTRNIKIYSNKTNGRNWPGNNSDRNMQLVYNGNLNIRDGIDVDVSINRFGKVFVDEQVMDRNNGYDNRNEDRDWDRDKQPMNDRSFQQFKQTLARERFEDARLNTAKTVINNNNLNTIQVKELMGHFSFEANKLELAKYCYMFTTDRQNYYSVADGFAHSSSKNELMRFIQQQN